MTSTETAVSMVKAGLGVSVVPLMQTGAVTRGRSVEVRRPLVDAIRPIHSGILLRRGTGRRYRAPVGVHQVPVPAASEIGIELQGASMRKSKNGASVSRWGNTE